MKGNLENMAQRRYMMINESHLRQTVPSLSTLDNFFTLSLNDVVWLAILTAGSASLSIVKFACSVSVAARKIVSGLIHDGRSLLASQS